MEFKKGVKGMMKRVSGQLSNRLGKVDMESMLSALGLEVIKHRRSMAWPVVGAFAIGVAVGALVTPINGKELRHRIMELINKKKSQIEGARELTADGQPVASPYEDAKAERNIRDNNMARKPGVRPPVIGEPGPHLSSPT